MSPGRKRAFGGCALVQIIRFTSWTVWGAVSGAGAQPYLGARTRIVRRQDDRWGVIPARCCLRPLGLLGAVQVVEAWRRAPYGSWPQSICVLMGMRTVLARLRGSLDRLLALGLAFDRGERRIAQFAQEVVGAAAEFARDREAGAVVVDASGDLQVVVVVG